MSRRGEIMAGSTRTRVLLATVGLLAALLLLAPGDARADWKSCVDKAFAKYNTCLMQSASWFERALCDANWEFDMAWCTAGTLGGIRAVYEEGNY
jgi:hypothetical protein